MPKPHHAAQSFESAPRPFIALQPVESNLIHSVGYDHTTATLAVTFKRKDGAPTAIYHYPDILRAAATPSYEDFIGAESIGKYHGAHIKDLPFKKYHPDPAEDEQTAEHVDASA